MPVTLFVMASQASLRSGPVLSLPRINCAVVENGFGPNAAGLLFIVTFNGWTLRLPLKAPVNTYICMRGDEPSAGVLILALSVPL